MSNEKLSLDGLIFEATNVAIKDYILTITLNRPDKKNAINSVMMNEVNYALAYAKQERKIRVVIIDAEGDIFCAGADLSNSKSKSNIPKLANYDDLSLSIRHLYKPVICKIQGSVLAGALLMVTNATHAIAVKDAKFSAPEIKRGLWPFMVMAGLPTFSSASSFRRPLNSRLKLRGFSSAFLPILSPRLFPPPKLAERTSKPPLSLLLECVRFPLFPFLIFVSLLPPNLLPSLLLFSFSAPPRTPSSDVSSTRSA